VDGGTYSPQKQVTAIDTPAFLTAIGHFRENAIHENSRLGQPRCFAPA
jgi:hypothetical protein